MRLASLVFAVLSSAALLGPSAMAQTAAPAPAPAPAHVAKPAAKADSSASVNINTASASELRSLPGIGPTRESAIVKGRPYTSADDLLAKKILPKSVFNKIKLRLTTG